MADFVEPEEMEALSEMVRDLDGMDGDVTTWEGEFLDTLLGWNGCFTTRQAEKLKKMHDKYLGVKR